MSRKTNLVEEPGSQGLGFSFFGNGSTKLTIFELHSLGIWRGISKEGGVRVESLVLKAAIWSTRICRLEGVGVGMEEGGLTVEDGEEVTAGAGWGRREIKKTTNEIKAAAGIRRINNLG